jgi:hypothetical protein
VIPTDAHEWSGSHGSSARCTGSTRSSGLCGASCVSRAEHACDDAVLRGAERTEYAQQLVGLARRLSAHPVRPVLAMVNRADLSARVLAVLGEPLAFDVASIKPNKSGDWRKGIGPAPGGRFTATNTTFRELVLFAYGFSQWTGNTRVIGGPQWIDTDHFDVVAKAQGMPSPQEMRVLVRTMLAARFRLLAHTETKELPVYALVRRRVTARLVRNSGGLTSRRRPVRLAGKRSVAMSRFLPSNRAPSQCAAPSDPGQAP